MDKITIEIGNGFELKLTQGEVVGTLIITKNGIGFKAANQRSSCNKILEFEKLGPMIEAVGNTVHVSSPAAQVAAQMDGRCPDRND